MKRITLIVFMILYIPVLLLRASNNVQDDFVDMNIDNSSLSCEDFDNNSLAVVLDKNGYLHVAYCLNDGASHIFYRYDNGSGILSPVIDNISVENCKPLALDIDNSSKYHLAFSLSGNDIAYKNQGDNDSQEVPSTSGIIDNLTTIGIADNSTNIFIVYGFDNSTSHYLFVYDNGSNNSYLIDDNNTDRFTGAAITVDGAYYYITYKVGTLQLFKTNNPMWDNRTIADNVTGDGISSIKFYNDYIDISYFDGNSLKLAKIGDNTTLYNMNIESGDFKYSAVNLFNSGENRIVIYSDNETLKYFNDDDNSSYIITDNFSLCPTYNPPAIKPFDLMATPDNKIIFGYYNSISDNFTYTYLPNTITLAITGNGKIQERSPDNRTLYNNDNLSYKYKTKISLTADPDSGYFFNGWGELCGSCGDNLSCNIIVNQDGYCMAQFSDTIEINGYVIDNNSFPVDNIKVHLCLINDNGELDCETNGKTYDTDSSGRFGFSNVAIGRYVIYTEPKDNYSIAWYNEVASENSEESPEFQNGATIIDVNPDKIKTNISGITIKLRNGKIVNGSILNGNNNDTIFVTPYYVDQESQIQVFDFPVEFNGDNFTIKGLQDDMWYSIGYHDNTNGVKYFNVALVKSGYDNITVDRNKIVGSFFIEGNIDNSQSLIDLKYLGLYRLKNFTENDLIEKYDLLSGQQYSFKNLTPGKYYIKLVGNSHECYLLKNGKFFCDWHGEYPIPLKIFEISNSNITEDILISDENYIFPDENELIRQDYNDVNIIVANNSDNVVSFDIYLEYDDSPLDKIPDHYHSNNSEISLKLDNLTYRYWALVEYDNGSVYTTNGWDNFTVDNSSIYLDNITTTPVHNTVIIFDNSSKNLSGNKLIIYKDDRIFKKIDFEKKFITDRYVIPYLPPGTYNFALDSHYLIPPSHISYPKFFTYCDNGTRDVTISENNFQFVCKSSEGYSLSGYVIDNSTNDNISDALVQIFFDNRKIFLPTDAKGYFSVYGLKPESSVIVKVQYDNKTGRIVIDNLTGDNISNVQIDESSYKVSGQLIYKNNSNNGLSGFIEFYNSDNQSMGSVFTNQDGSFTFYNTDDSDVRYGVRYYSSYYRSSDDISSGSTNIIIDLPGPFPWEWYGFFEVDTEGIVGKRNYDFGNVAVDSYKIYDIYIFNNSNSTASVNNISLQNNQAFSIDNETCTDDNEVRPYSNCKISVKFSPDTLGEDYEDYLIAYIFNRKYTLKLSGTCAGGLVRNGESEGGNSGGGIISGGDSGSGIISGGRDETEDKINDISDAIGELNDKLDTLNENNVSYFYMKVNKLFDDILDVIDKINERIKNNQTINPNLSLKIMSEIGDLINISTSIYSYGGKININNLTKSLNNLKNLLAPVIQAKEKQNLENILNNTININTKLRGLVKNLDNINDISNLAGTIKNLSSYGLKSAIYSGAPLNKTELIINSSLNVIKEAVKSGVEKFKDVDNLVSMLENSGKVTGELFKNISSLKGEVSPEVKDIFLKKSEQGLISITSEIDNSIAKLDKKSIGIKEAIKVKTGLSSMCSSIITVSDKGVSKEVFDTVKKSVEVIINKISDDIKFNPENYSKIVKIAAIKITSGLLQKPGSSNVPNNIKKFLSDTIPPDYPFINEKEKSLKPKDILSSVLSEVSDFKEAKTDKETNTTRVKISGKEYPIFISDILIISGIKEKYFQHKDGTLFINDNGILERVSPAPYDEISLLNKILQIFSFNSFSSKNDLNYIEINKDGLIKTKIRNKILIGTFSYTLNKENSLSAGTVSFSMSASDPASAAYSILVHYENGVNQKINPFIQKFDKLSNFLDNYSNLNYQFNREDGILYINTNNAVLKYKPDFFISPINEGEKQWFNQNKNASGIAFKFGDYNNDGIGDVKYYTEEGSQILYGVH